MLLYPSYLKELKLSFKLEKLPAKFLENNTFFPKLEKKLALVAINIYNQTFNKIKNYIVMANF